MIKVCNGSSQSCVMWAYGPGSALSSGDALGRVVVVRDKANVCNKPESSV